MADFVGRDRGFRALSFTLAGDLPVRAEPTALLGAAAPPPEKDDRRWVLVTGPDGQPRGWLDRDHR